jgi:hypothetical protein
MPPTPVPHSPCNPPRAGSATIRRCFGIGASVLAWAEASVEVAAEYQGLKPCDDALRCHVAPARAGCIGGPVVCAERGFPRQVRGWGAGTREGSAAHQRGASTACMRAGGGGLIENDNLGLSEPFPWDNFTDRDRLGLLWGVEMEDLAAADHFSNRLAGHVTRLVPTACLKSARRQYRDGNAVPPSTFSVRMTVYCIPFPSYRSNYKSWRTLLKAIFPRPSPALVYEHPFLSAGVIHLAWAAGSTVVLRSDVGVVLP